jgi:NADPH:quinone reductase-like Zn-dependent oxidoreductase
VTAWTGIRRILEVESSDVVIVHGASGPVGISAVQFAAWTHARVIAVASHDADVLRELGASETFDDRDAAGRPALADAARRATKLLLLAPWPTEMTAALEGLIIAYPNGVDAPKSVEAAAFDGVPDRQLWDQVDSQMNAHRFVLPIAAAFPLDRVADAHAALTEHHSAGKIIWRVGQG